MKRLVRVAEAVVPAKFKRAIQGAEYFLSDRSGLEAVRPWPKPLGYDRIYHFHIRKTAGSSLNTAFKNAFADPASGMVDEEAIFKRNWGVVAGRVYVNHNKYLLERGDYFYGDGHAAVHELKLPRNTFKITILRDPAARVISHYRMLMHWRRDDFQHPARAEEDGYLGDCFSDFLDRIPRQHLMRQLYMFSKSLDPDEAIENVGKMNFILLTETFTEHLQRLATLLQIDLRLYAQKASFGPVKVTEAERARLVDLLEPEYRLVRAAAPLAGVHLNYGRATRADEVDAGAVVMAEAH